MCPRLLILGLFRCVYTIDLGEHNEYKEFSEKDLKSGIVTKTEDFDTER